MTHTDHLDSEGKIFLQKNDIPVSCRHQDADELDKNSWHLLGCKMDGTVSGAGREVVRRCLELCKKQYPKQDIRISAQTYLTDFYRDFGFQAVSEPYDDEGIEHVDMILRTS